MPALAHCIQFLWLGLAVGGVMAVAAIAQDPTDVQEAMRHLRANEPGAYESAVAMGEPMVEGLVQVMRDDAQDPMIRYMAINALGEIGSKKAVKPLLAALNDPFFNIRRCAAMALGRIGDPAARAPLMQLARQDPFAWQDPQTGRLRYLVREEARAALELLDGRGAPRGGRLQKEKETFLADAARLPPLPAGLVAKRLSWPFPGDFREQNIFNNYQQPTDVYVHGGLDFIHEKGTEVRAVEDGFIAAIATNYPEWKTHHFFIVAREKDGREGWCYTHLDPDSYTFKPGDRIRQGQVLGKLVDFHVGKEKGVDHLHLQYARFSRSGDKVDVESLADPLLFFDWRDALPPVIHEPFHFVRAGTLDEFPAGPDGIAVVRGPVDIVVGISDVAFDGHACNWAVPVITLEITGEKAPPWRKLVLDQRGAIPASLSPPALYLSSREGGRWLDGRPRFPVIHLAKVTQTDGDGVIEEADRLQHWDTRNVPDGIYQVTVRAWDLKGNAASRAAKVRIANKASPSNPR